MRGMETVNKAATPKRTYAAPLTYSDAITQLGTTGIKRVGKDVREEYLRELQGSKGRAKFREMYNHDVVRRAIRAIKLPMLQATWHVEPGEGADGKKAAIFIEQCRNDLSQSWYRWLDDCITGTTVYGASWYQTLYKRRLGPDQKDPTKRSRYNDGLWGWRKFSPRGQETWDGWTWDENGDMSGLIQQDPYGGTGPVIVPLDRSLHFVIEGRSGDPEGESLLRSAYVPYYALKHAENWAGILIERMGGVPHFKSGEGYDIFDDSDPDMRALRAYLENACTALRLDEQMGVVTPFGIDFELKAVPVRVEEIVSFIQLCSWRILASLLAQFMELGQAPKGSFAKSQSDKEFFLLACQAILTNCIAETLNRYEIPRLLALNAGSFPRLETLPWFVPSDIQVPNLGELAEPLAKLIEVMAITPGPNLEKHLKGIGKLPEEEEAQAPALVGPTPPRQETEEPGEPAEPDDLDGQPTGDEAPPKGGGRKPSPVEAEKRGGDHWHMMMADLFP